MPNGGTHVDRLEVPSNTTNNERTRLLHDSQPIDSPPDTPASRGGYFFENVAQGVQDRDRAHLKRELVRYTSFIWAILSWQVGDCESSIQRSH